MKNRIISILLLLVVVIGFSGVANATTHQELVKEAWDEEVLVTPEIPAYDEPVFDHWLVNGEYTVYHPPVLISEEIPAWDEVISEAIPAWNELISPEIPAWNETISEAIPAFEEQVGQKEFNKQSDADKYGRDKVRAGLADSYKVNKVWECYHYVYVTTLFKHHDAVPAVIVEHPTIPAVYEFHPEVPAVIMHHDLIPAVYEPAYYEQVPYTGNGPYYGGSPETGIVWEDVMAWSNWIYTNGPNVTGGWGSWSHYYSLIHHDAIPAVYEIIHHPAEYITVEDPVVPPVNPPVNPPVEPPVKETPVADEPVADEPVAEEPTSVDIPVTGGSFGFLFGALGIILVGMLLAFVLRRKEDE